MNITMNILIMNNLLNIPIMKIILNIPIMNLIMDIPIITIIITTTITKLFWSSKTLSPDRTSGCPLPFTALLSWLNLQLCCGIVLWML